MRKLAQKRRISYANTQIVWLQETDFMLKIQTRSALQKKAPSYNHEGALTTQCCSLLQH